MHECPSGATLQLQCGAISLNRNADNCNLPAAIVSSTSFHIVINNLSKMPTIPQHPVIFLGDLLRLKHGFSVFRFLKSC